jgi:HlyD family secretion protein
MNQVDFEKSVLEFANSKADVVRSQVSVENARIALADTEVRAPISGTVIEKNVEKGQVISSPTKDVGGGTVLLKMANLDVVQVRTLVDETDIGKIRAGLPATVTVAAYPQQPLEGKVLKIEPQAQDEQTVTMFAVLINLDNSEGLLRPGMNAEVTINIARSMDKPAIPTIALRTARDLGPASRYLGIESAAGSRGRPVKPSGGDAKKSSGKRPSMKGGGRPSSGGRSSSRRGGGKKNSNYMFGGEYWVFVLRDGTPTAIKIKTGITDLEYSEVTSGLEVGDEVILLPSSGLIMAQERRKGFMKRDSGVPGVGG